MSDLQKERYLYKTSKEKCPKCGYEAVIVGRFIGMMRIVRNRCKKCGYVFGLNEFNDPIKDLKNNTTILCQTYKN